MKPFLKQVADHYYNIGNIASRCFVFPNRRSMVFFRKYLAEAVASDENGVPVVMPRMTTINDLFFEAAGVKPADRVRLLLDLYDCYALLNPRAEPLDEFVFWGDVILADFNDVDKYLVDPQQLFANVADYKQIQDTFSYLTETQRKAIERFVSHFNDLSGKLTVNLEPDSPDVKGRFLQIWNILYPLYEDFNAALKRKGVAYEGKVYKELALKVRNGSVADIFRQTDDDAATYVFVGLNALNECERLLLRKLRDASMAEYCWDWSGDMIRDERNRSSLFMKENVVEFPQAFELEETGVPEVNVLSVASSAGQAKMLPEILASVDDPQRNCAVVLPDENLLVPVLNSIPPHIRDINVTMGLPMSGSLIYSLMSDVSDVQLHVARRNGQWMFYHKHVWDLFSNELFRKAADEETLKIMAKVRKDARYYIPLDELCGTPLTDAVFKVVIEDPKARDGARIHAFAEYLKGVIKAVAPAVSGNVNLYVEAEFAKEYYRGVTMLQDSLGGKDGTRDMLPQTYVRLLSRLLGPVSVPFRGEPLKGLQVMGPLEMRALDFDTLIIMSANEGVFPRRNVSSSFIPPELRKGFGLPTYEYQDAIWAYYFYRMISRAGKVWMLVDSRTEGLKSGEESRYIKQLEYHFGLHLNRYVLKYDDMSIGHLNDIAKTEEDIETIRNVELSATTLQNYLACPAKFYYGTVRRLKAEDEVAESLDYGMFGTVYHDTMRSLYTSEEAMAEDFFFGHKGEGLLEHKLTHVTRQYIKKWLGREDDIRRKVKALIADQINALDISGRNLVVTDVIVRYVMKTLQRDLELLEAQGSESFEILGREIKVQGQFHGLRFKGYIDRLDSLAPGQARVVDYKTGKVLDDDVDIHDGNAEAIAESIFARDIKERPKIALQFFIYDLLLKGRDEISGRQICNSVYSTSRLFKEPPVTVPLNAKFFDAVSERLEGLIDEMCDPGVGFRRTEDEKVCTYCDFKTICGR